MTVEKIGRQMTDITGDIKERIYQFQQLSEAQKVEM